VIYRPVDESGDSHRQLTAAGCDISIVDVDGDLDQALNRVRPIHAVLAASLRRGRLVRRQLEALPDLRIVAKYTIGVDDIDVAAATELGILVTHSPTEANWGGVAEGTIAMMLALLKRLAMRDAAVKSGGWRSHELRGTYLGRREDGYPGITLGIVGLGRVGRRVATLMAPWKVSVVAADPYVDEAVFRACGAERVSLDELLRLADVVTLHCPLNDETERLIDAKKLRSMKPNALLINTARGRIVDIDAVCDALDANRLTGAAFDVLPEEPPPPDARILKMGERVILSPHMIAANHGGTLAAAIPGATQAVLSALKGQVPPNVYNQAAIEGFEARFAGKSLLKV
jgi:phosphoglycerate dehydrogenase-like enzyme